MTVRTRRRSRRVAPKQQVDTALAESSYFKNPEDSAYADALLSLFSRSNTILTGRDISCTLSEQVAIAATDGKVILFNVGQVAHLIRGLRIVRRLPDEVEYAEALTAIYAGKWSHGRLDYHSLYERQKRELTYLYKKYAEYPELFPHRLKQSSDLALPNWSGELSYQDFIRALTQREMKNSVRSFATLRGLNYHELSHCIYTPTNNSKLRNQISDLSYRTRATTTGGMSEDFERKFFSWAGFSQAQMDLYYAKCLDGKWAEANEYLVKEDSDAFSKFHAIIRLAKDGQFWHKMFNTLEDQRIESLFVAKFPTSRHFFTSIVLRYIAKHDKVEQAGQYNDCGWRDPHAKQGGAYILLHGRRYLQKSLRNQYRELIVKDFDLTDSQVCELEKLIDKYRSLSDFRSADAITNAVDTIWSFGMWVLEHITDPTQLPEPDGGFDHENHGQTGKGTNKKSSEEAQKQREAQEEKWEKEESEDSEDSDDTDDSGDADDSEDSDDAEDSDADSDDDSGDTDDSEDSDGNADGEKDSDSKNRDPRPSDVFGTKSDNHADSTKASQQEGKVQSTEELREALKQSEDAVSEEAFRQIETLHDIVKKNKEERFFRNLYPSDEDSATPLVYRSLSNAVSTALAKLRSDRDNQWEKSSATGVLNVLKYAEARGTHTDFFDEWQEDGDERPDAEICILLDLSSSMNSRSFKSLEATVHSREKGEEPKPEVSNAFDASCAMWAIKNACQRNELPCSVIGYSDSAYALYSANDTVLGGTVPVFNGIAGTRPTEAITIAKSVLDKSDAKHRILVSISDGDWVAESPALSKIESLNKNGVQTVFIQLPSRAEYVRGDIDANGHRPIVSVSPEFTNNGKKWGGGFYNHTELLQVKDSATMAKHIGAILLKAVRR
jgi:hypothetical protein